MEKLLNILKEVFDLDHVESTISFESAEEWDSFSHMNLIVSLETEFNIAFTKEEIIEMLDIKSIVKSLIKKGINLD